MERKVWLLTGVFFFVLGVIRSVVYSDPHFYSYLSIGLVILSFLAYIYYTGSNPFESWSYKEFISYSLLLLLFAFITDYLGVNVFGFWEYPFYDSLLNWSVQKTLEFALPLVYIQLFFMLGCRFFEKRGVNEYMAIVLSLLTFSIATGVLTEFVNSYADSWRILSMPISNAEIAGFSVVFTTIGYWIMALVPYAFYLVIELNRYEKLIE